MTDVGRPDPYRLPVSRAVEAFRKALVALVPPAEMVGLTWKDEESYDEWERIAEAMFDVFVGTPIQHDVGSSGTEHPLPRYGFEQRSYEKFSWLELDDDDDDAAATVLVGFASRASAFDTVRLARVDLLDGAVLERLTPMAFSTPVRLRRRRSSGESELVRDLYLAE